MNRLRIGEMAKMNYVTVQTLRHYDQVGLLEPAHVDEETGYRYYDIRQSAKLDLIQYFKSMGMSLDKIREKFDKKDAMVIRETLREHQTWLEEQIQDYQLKHRAAERCVHNLDRYLRASQKGSINVQHIPERKIFCHDSGIDLYQNTLDTYEIMIRQLKQHAILQHVPMVYFCNVGTVVRYEDLLADRFVSTETFLFMDEGLIPGELLETVAEGDYLCAYCHAFEEEIACARRLFQAVKEGGYTIDGDYLCEVVTELPLFRQEERNMFIKLQIKVKTP
ncbi:MAG: helix-turn-helix domain-containing protein [Bacillota bacterium]|nr:helix-turn-helix domain-containing protein [Bacillota bacterium]MDW7678394.1 helix-turn-helix domain-containing protein [Bacillota bacterium]